MNRIYDPPLTIDGNSPLYRLDKAVKSAQLQLDTALAAKRHHTNQNLAHVVIKEAREALKKAEKVRALKVAELRIS